MAKKKFGFGDHYCVFCGERVEKNSQHCPKCSKPYTDDKFAGIERMGAGGIGWSDKINDPSFKKNRKKTKKSVFICMILVSVIIGAVLFLSGQLEADEGGFKIFGGIMAIIWGFWFLWLIFGGRKKKDWDGTVENKEIETEEYTETDDDGHRHRETRTVYKIYFRTDGGKRKTDTSYTDSNWFQYLSVGDKVRFHGNGINYYEKYDKSNDTSLPCAYCMSLRDARENYCGRCGAAMLKGKPSAQQRFVQNQINYAQPVADQPRNDAAAPKKAKFCPQCGAKSEGGAFCSSCGYRLN